MTQKPTLYLIDGTAYIHRAYHAIRSLTTSRGFPSNAAFGFTRMLVKLMEEKKPEYTAMFFDSKGPTFRHEMYSDYKANRPSMPDDMAVQIPYIKKITEGFSLPIFEKQGYEADDLIGTLAEKAARAGFFVVMVTGDKDFIQLVTDDIIIWDPMKDLLIDPKAVRETYCIEPHQMKDVLALAGDISDNIPGVPGIGQKTALSLLKVYRDVEDLYARIDEIKSAKQREKLQAHERQARLSKELATIHTDCPVAFDAPAFKRGEPDNARLAQLFKELEFRQLQKDYPAPSDLSKKDYRTVCDEPGLSDLVEKIKKAGICAVDTETTGLDPMRVHLVGLSFAMRPDEAYYIPCGHECAAAGEQQGIGVVLDRLKPVLEDPGIIKVGQNIKYDWTVLRRHGVELRGKLFDTMLASYLLNPEKREHGLEQIAIDLLGHKMISYKEVIQAAGKVDNFSQVPIDQAAVYSCEDADCTLMAYEKLRPMLEAAGLIRLYETVEVPLIPVLMKMEMTGIRVDRDRLTELSKEFSLQLEQICQQIYSLAGGEFNINSSQQLGKVLFEQLKLPRVKKTKKKTGYSTDVEVLTALSVRHELPALVLRHRTLTRLKSTYVDSLFDLINPETGRIHTSFNQTVAATGRLSSSQPNLQNIPIRTEEGRDIRRAFIPRPGWRFLSADYSQVELRLLAHYSNDQILIDAFLNQEDIHIRTAAEVFEALPAMITPDLRRQAKMINFGIIYGMGAFSLAKELNISPTMAKTYIDHYFRRYKGVKRFIDESIAGARQTGRVETELGRIRFIPDINSKNPNLRGFAERTAVNTRIQGTAADLIKLAMIRMDQVFSERGLKSAMLLSVHDELLFEVPPAEMDEVAFLAKEIMENIWTFKVPLEVNVEEGGDWSEAH